MCFCVMNIVISLGGSILLSDFKSDKIKQYIGILCELNEDHNIVVVTGGGTIARDYIKVEKQLGANDFEADETGIMVTRLNAKVLLSGLGDLGYPCIPTNFDEVKGAFNTQKIVVMGGTFPSISTDGTSALVAEAIHADLFINATSVDGVYDSDPKKNKDAKIIKNLTYSKLSEILSSNVSQAGTYALFDRTAIDVLNRSNIPCVVVNGHDPNNIKKAIGREIGTYISNKEK